MKASLCVEMVALLGFGVAQAGVVIDNFDAGNVVYSGPNSSYEDTLGANTLGGDRATDVDVAGTRLEINDPNPPFDTTGVLAFSNDLGTAGTLTLVYTSPGADLTDGGAIGVRFLFVAKDHESNLALTITDGDTDSA